METNEFDKRFTGQLGAMLLAARSVLRSDDKANDVVQDAYVRLAEAAWRRHDDPSPVLRTECCLLMEVY